MAQTDYTIANSSGAVFRARINELAAAVKSGNSGPTAPSDPVAGMVWVDTSVSPPVFRQRNGANDGWNIVLSGADIEDLRTQLEIAPLSGRNLIINGSGRINQREYTSGTATTSANQFTLDRWFVITSGESLTFTGDDSRRVMTAPAGGVAQVIEGKNITGGTYVLNWDGTATATVNGTARAKGETFALPANTNATVAFFGGTYADVQLEKDFVTPFEHRSIGQELALCQRYFQLSLRARAGGVSASGIGFAGYTNLYVEMRGIPTLARQSISVVGSTTDVNIISVDSRYFDWNMPNATGGAGIGNATYSASAELIS